MSEGKLNTFSRLIGTPVKAITSCFTRSSSTTAQSPVEVTKPFPHCKQKETFTADIGVINQERDFCDPVSSDFDQGAMQSSANKDNYTNSVQGNNNTETEPLPQKKRKPRSNSKGKTAGSSTLKRRDRKTKTSNSKITKPKKSTKMCLANPQTVEQIDKCSNKGHFSMYKLLKSTRQLALPTDLGSQLFDSVVSPVMTYGSEVWGNVDVTELESVHLKFCKYILGTNKFTTNVMIYGEHGRHPINIEITGKILNFWASMTQNVCYKMSVIMYNVLYNLYVKNIYKSPWIEFVKRKLDELGLSYMWVNQNVGDYSQFKSLIKQRMLDQHLQTWKSKVDALLANLGFQEKSQVAPGTAKNRQGKNLLK